MDCRLLRLTAFTIYSWFWEVRCHQIETHHRCSNQCIFCTFLRECLVLSIYRSNTCQCVTFWNQIKVFNSFEFYIPVMQQSFVVLTSIAGILHIRCTVISMWYFRVEGEGQWSWEKEISGLSFLPWSFCKKFFFSFFFLSFVHGLHVLNKTMAKKVHFLIISQQCFCNFDSKYIFFSV